MKATLQQPAPPIPSGSPPRPLGSPVGNPTAVLWLVTIVAALYFGREILLPFALAVLLSFLLAPSVKRLERRRIPRTAAVMGVVAVAVLSVGLLTYVVWQQLYDLGNQLPKYEGNITAKAKVFQDHGDGVIHKISTVFDHLRNALKPPAATPPADVPAVPNPTTANNGAPETPKPAADSPPLKVEVVEPVSMVGLFGHILGPLGGSIGSGLIVVVFVIFMLLEREDLRNRFIRLVGPQQINFTTQALDAAANRVSRYLRMQLIINVVFGLIAAVGLFILDVPNPVLWGSMAGLLRFVPFIGPIIGGLIPVMISLAIFDGWLHPFLVLGLFALDELLANNFLEPKLYGSSTGVSPLAVVVSMVFWMWLWGPVGLILAMPLTVCLTVMGSYVPRLGFLTTLLSDQDALSPPVRFYQRLLALDVEEALEVCEDYLKEHPIVALCDNVLVPALRLAQTDRHHGTLEESKHQLVIQTVRDAFEDLSRQSGAAEAAAAEAAASDPEAPKAEAASPAASDELAAVVCVPAHDMADEVVGMMVVELLSGRGVKAQNLSSTSLSSELVGEAARLSPAVVCVSALPPFSVMHARYLCKRLAPEIGATTTLMAGLWQPAEETAKGEQKLAQTGVSSRVSSVSEAVETIAKLVTSTRLLNCA